MLNRTFLFLPDFVLEFRVMKESNNRQFSWNICGHEKIVRFLQSAIIHSHLAQAYLFTGPSHLGKETVARKFIASLLCADQGKNLPCGECLNCRQLKNGLHPDFYVVGKEINLKTEKARKEIVIDQVRELKYKLQQATLFNGYKVALITEAQLMNASSANAILKILEEPTRKTVIIILADDISNLPLTILSRCQLLKFLPVPTLVIKSYLENSGAFNSDLLARQSHHCPGLALNFLNDQELAKSAKDNANNFFQALKADLNSRFTLVDKIINWDKDENVNIFLLNNLLEDWQLMIRDLVLIKSDNESLITNLKQLPELKNEVLTLDFPRIRAILAKISQAYDYSRHNINSKSILENLIINL